MTTPAPEHKTGPQRAQPTTHRIIIAAGLMGLAGALTCLAVFFLARGLVRRVAGPDGPLVSTAGQLAFISDRDGPHELYLMDADGSDVRRLTYDGGGVWDATWSPDGRYLAYVQGRVEEADVYILDVEAALQEPGQVAPLRLTDQTGFDGAPIWSPDGSWLVFRSGARAPAGAYLVDAADFLAAPTWSQPKLLAAWAGNPVAWAPDGAHLACVSYMGGLTLLETGGLSFQAQAGDVGEIYLAPGEDPSWSPDGRQLVFTQDGDLYRVNVDGTSLLRLTDTSADEYGAAWSPDGQQIAYLSRDQRNTDLGRAYVMSADGTQGRRLSSMGADDLAWSPDSTRLAFYSNRGSGPGVNGEIWVMNRDGSGLTALSDHPAFDSWPIWRPAATSPALERVPDARATLESVRARAERGVSRNADWTPYIRELGGMPMALVPAGCFQMGRAEADIQAALARCREADPDCQPPAGLELQSPAHEICFDEPFWISVNEVTVGQYREFGEKGECFNDGEGDQRPCQETWYGAHAYCEHYGTRLPSEAEWEYAARGPDGSLFPWGDDFVRDNLVWGASGAAEVGSKPGGASWVGALDMLGNAWEWVNSGYGPYPYTADDGREEGVCGPYETCVLRGHGWDDAQRPLWESGVWTAASRGSDLPARPPQPSYGFRCARSYE